MSDIKEKETTNKEEIKENEIVGGGKQKEKKRLKGKTKKQLPRITDTEQYILQTVKGQNELEDLMEDGIEFDTENVIFFLAGAFSGIEKIKEKRNGTKSLGFSISAPDPKKNNKDSNKTTKEDLIAYGLTEEFVGRIDTIVEMNELSVDVLEEILRNSKKSKLNQYVRELRRYGILVEYDENLPRAIAKKAKNGNTGARELSNVVNYMFDKILYDVMSAPKNTYKKCILQEGIEEENTKYKLE